MEPQNWDKIETLYRAALGREPAQRQAFLVEACKGDEALRVEIESLLAYGERADKFLEIPAMEVEAKSMAADPTPSLIGQRLSHYRIIEKLGSGGMGEVYRARDDRLNRDVAIKVVSNHFSDRFEREARLIAALNHQNICTLHDVGPNYLVMELVEGPTLADRIQQGPILLKEALRIAKQIEAALDTAHEKGIVHRDLKPSNIKIKPDGTVKVLDFGLAKTAFGSTGSSSDESPTLATAKTESGVIMGTAGYMAPEQARGKPVDKRSDIWAFGVILYEMLSGLPAFQAETFSDTIAAVLQKEPDWNCVPPQSRHLVQRCLEKDPKNRLRDIGDAQWELERIGQTRLDPLVSVERPFTGRSMWLIAAALLLTAVATTTIVWRIKQTGSLPLRRFELPVHTRITALSPDGSRVAYILGDHLYVRPLDALQALDLGAIPRAQQSVGPSDGTIFWSPNGRTVAFSTDGTLRSIPAEGGTTFLISKVPASGLILGGAWRRDETIVFSVWRDSLYKVSATGGTPELYLAVDATKEVDFHGVSALPDKRVIVTTHLRGDSYRTEIFDGQKRTVLTTSPQVPGVIYAAPGYLLFGRNDANSGIWALPFAENVMDLSKAVLLEPGARGVDAAEDGTLLLRLPSAAPTKSEFVWVDRNGMAATVPGTAVELRSPIALSPDGDHALFVAGPAFDVFQRDLVTGTDTRLTFDATRKAVPKWSPRGDKILYSIMTAVEATKMVVRPANGTGDARELGPGQVGKISANGSQILYVLDDRGRGRLRHAPVLTDGSLGPPERVSTTDDEGDVTSFDLSPDGNLIAYTVVTPNSGPDVFLTEFPSGNGRWQVSNGTPGFVPRFSHDGRELFYFSGTTNGKLVSVPVTPSPSVKLGPPVTLLDLTNRENNGLIGAAYDVSPDGRRFLMPRTLRSTADDGPRLVILQNWLATLKK